MKGVDVIRFSFLAWVPGEGRSTEAIGVLGTRLLSVYWGTGQGFLGRDLSSFGTPSGGRRKLESLDWVRVRKITAPNVFLKEISPFFRGFLLLIGRTRNSSGSLVRKKGQPNSQQLNNTADEWQWLVLVSECILKQLVGSLWMEVTPATRKVTRCNKNCPGVRCWSLPTRLKVRVRRGNFSFWST